MSSIAKHESHPYMKFLADGGGGDIDNIYDALGKDDPSEVVVTTMNALKHTVDLEFKKDYKLEKISNLYRNEGNQFYSAKKFRPALQYYNRALLYAPKNSQAMILAYSNRSALLCTVRAYTACINDIETVFSIGCTNYELTQRLNQRKFECTLNAWTENLLLASELEKRFFKLDVKRHPEIPCARNDVDVVTESGLPKIVAAKKIPVGTLVAIEQPFVSALDEDNNNISCHYCHKLSFNLIPCDGCCVALFCDEECKKNCKKEYHDMECKNICYNHEDEFTAGPVTKMALRAALKMRQMCKSWKELVDASNNIGEDRMRTSTVRDIYDVKSKFSLICHNNTNHFVHGERFNISFTFGMMIRDLANNSAFFPNEADERDAAIRAFARIMVHLYLSYRGIEIINAAKEVSSMNITTDTESNFGWFSFAGKLKHSCNANLLVMGLKNNVALVAIRPIKKGDELTISFLGHYFENIPASRQFRLFGVTQKICKCRVCIEKWSSINMRKMGLTKEQTKAFLQSAMAFNNAVYRGNKSLFTVVCEGLTGLEGAECTREYHELYREFRNLTTYYQFLATNNTFIKKNGDDN